MMCIKPENSCTPDQWAVVLWTASSSPATKVDVAVYRKKAIVNWPARKYQGLNHKIGICGVFVRH